jgi:hypothetical protein
MKFTVERKALVKMLQCVEKKRPTQTRRDKQVRLSAHPSGESRRLLAGYFQSIQHRTSNVEP